MIGSFRHKGLKEFFESGKKSGIPPELAARIARRLDVLEAAQQVSDINAHGFNLHKLKGERQMSGRSQSAATGGLLSDR